MPVFYLILLLIFNQANAATQPASTNAIHIEALAAIYFENSPSATPDLTWLTNKNKQQQFFDFKQQLGKAIDQGQNLKFLATFGLQAHHPTQIKNSYLINLKTHPKWASFNNLFLAIGDQYQLFEHHHRMRQFGFSEEELEQLKQQLTQYPQTQVHQLNQRILKHYIAAQAQKHHWSAAQAAKRFISQSKKQRFVNTNQWAESILNSLEPPTQQRLIAYLQKQLGLIGLAQAPWSHNELTQLGEQLFSEYQQFLRCRAKQQTAQL